MKLDSSALTTNIWYYLCLVIFSVAAASFIFSFTTSYFDPAYLVELRSAASLFTILALGQTINPYASGALEQSANLYSVVWPIIIYIFGDIFHSSNIYEYRHIAFMFNYIIVGATSLLCIYTCIRIGFDLLAAVVIGMTVVLLNTARISMGEWGYSSGLCLSIISLILAVNGTRSIHFFISLMLITIASLFKVYFLLFSIIVISMIYCRLAFSYRSIAVTAAWGVASLLAYAVLMALFPYLFDMVIAAHRGFISFDSQHIFPQLVKFLILFGFSFILMFKGLADTWEGGFLQSRCFVVYSLSSVLFGVCVVRMLGHIGNDTTYLVHLVGPIIVSLSMRRRQSGQGGSDWFASMAGAIALTATLFQPWSTYGVLNSSALNENRRTLALVNEIIASNDGAKFYLEFGLAPIAANWGLEYVDTGNREYIHKYMADRAAGAFNARYEILLGPRRPPVAESPLQVMGASDLVICSVQCSLLADGFTLVKEIGQLHFAWGQNERVSLFRRVSLGARK